MRPDPIRTKNLQLNLAATAVLNLMRFGQSLQMEYCETGPRWRLSGGSKVKNDVARLVIVNPKVVADGDTLFPGTISQTWRIK